jgi:hypothetical protein
MEHNRHPRSSATKSCNYREREERESAARPTEGRVLNYYPGAKPILAFAPKLPQRTDPALFLPWHARLTQLDSSRRECSPQERAIVFHAVDRRVSAPK